LPALTWAATPIVLSLALRRRGFFRVWGLLASAAIALDAWLDLDLSPLPARFATPVAIAFVILGDFRYFVALTPDRPGRALGRSLVVPVATQLVRFLLPALVTTPRLTFLVYEVSMLVWLLVLSPRERPRLTAFVAAQYALWAAIDVLVLAAGPSPWLALRLVPDVLYYVLFVPYVLRYA